MILVIFRNLTLKKVFFFKRLNQTQTTYQVHFSNEFVKQKLFFIYLFKKYFTEKLFLKNASKNKQILIAILNRLLVLGTGN